MWIWEFRKEGIIIKRVIKDELIGEQTIERKISYRNLSNLNGLEITIKTPIEPIIEDDVLKAIRMFVKNYRKVKTPAKLEEVPEEETPEYVKIYNKQIEEEGTLPNTIRKIIKEKGSISDGDLKSELIKRGYKGTGGSIGATIRVLKLRGEIEVIGRGKDKIYYWIGN